MKILAIEKEIEGAIWEDTEKLLEQEAQHVFQLYLSKCQQITGGLPQVAAWLDRKVVQILKFCASYQVQWKPRLPPSCYHVSGKRDSVRDIFGGL